MAKIAIVIGASGLIGRALVDQLVKVEQISKVITLTRRVSKHASDKVFNHVVDYECLEDHLHLFIKADFLFSCLGTTLKQAKTLDAQYHVDVHYQFNAAKIAAQSRIAHYLLVSSAGANAHSKRPYLKMKGELEQRIKGLPFKRISIFQPSLLVGQREELRVAEKIGAWVMRGLSFIPVLRRYRPITGTQVALKMVQVSQQSGERLEFFCLDELFR